MTFDEAREGDEVYEQHGLRVIVDSTSLFYIDGANIDYIDNLMGGGFHIENPQAVSSCGCGSSFRTAKTHDGEEVPEKSAATKPMRTERVSEGRYGPSAPVLSEQQRIFAFLMHATGFASSCDFSMRSAFSRLAFR